MGKEAKFVVRLSVNERLFLNGLVAETRTAKERALRSRLFLKADADGPCWTDLQIADAFDISTLKVARLRKRCVLEGLEAALCQRPQGVRKPRKLDGAGEARRVVLVCGQPPSGRSQWTLQLLADKLVELKVVDEITDETVRKTLVTARRTAKDYAEAIRYLVDELPPDAEKIVLVQDNLNTHKPASLYQAFPPEEARRLIDKLEIHDTRKQGSWLLC